MTTQVAIGIGVAIGIVTSLAVSSSSNSMFASINQFQLYMLIPLSKAYLHKNLIQYIEGFEFTGLVIDLIDFEKIELLKYPALYYNVENDDEYLSNIGVEYMSSFRNMMFILLMLTLLILIHATIVLPFYVYSIR